MSQPTCETCRFWVWFDELVVSGPIGDCRRRAPTMDHGNRKRTWPFTLASDWCGEHQTPESVESIDEFVRRTRQPAPDAQTPAQGRGGEKANPDTP